MMAWYIDARRSITWSGLLNELRLQEPFVDRRASPAVKKVRKTLRVFAELGLVVVDDVQRPVRIAAADRMGLARVMAVGLEEYAASRGVSLRRESA
jgi:hypothetical protein